MTDKELKKQFGTKKFEKDFDKWTSNLSKEQYLEFMRLDEIRMSMLDEIKKEGIQSQKAKEDEFIEKLKRLAEKQSEEDGSYRSLIDIDELGFIIDKLAKEVLEK